MVGDFNNDPFETSDLFREELKPFFPSIEKDEDPEIRTFVANGKEVVFISKLDDTSSIPKSPVGSTDLFYLVKIEDEEYYMEYCESFVGRQLIEDRTRIERDISRLNALNFDSHFIFPKHLAIEKDKDIGDGFGWLFKIPPNCKKYQLMEAYGSYSDRVRNALIITSVFRALGIRGLTLCDFSRLNIYINRESGDYFLNCNGLIRALGTVINEPLSQNKYCLPQTLLVKEHSLFSIESLEYALKEKIREQLFVYEYDKTENPSFIRQILEGTSLLPPFEWLKCLTILRNRIVVLPSGREVYVDNLETTVVPIKKSLGFIVNEKQGIHYDGKIVYQTDVFLNLQNHEKIIGKISQQEEELYIQNVSGYQWRVYDPKTRKVSKMDNLQLCAIYEGVQIEFFDGCQKKVGKYQSLRCTEREEKLVFMEYRFSCDWESFSGVTSGERYFGTIIREEETNSLILNHNKVITGEQVKEFERLVSRFLCVKRTSALGPNWGNCGIPEEVILKYDDGREYYLDDKYKILPIIREVSRFWDSLYSDNAHDYVRNSTVVTCGYGFKDIDVIKDSLALGNAKDLKWDWGTGEEREALNWAKGSYFSFRFEELPKISVCHIYNETFIGDGVSKYFTVLAEQPMFTIRSVVLHELLMKIENKLTSEYSSEELYISMKKKDGSTITNRVTMEFIESIVNLISEYGNGVAKTMKVVENKMESIFGSCIF